MRVTDDIFYAYVADELRGKNETLFIPMKTFYRHLYVYQYFESV